jgi:hypothetical protein
MNPWKPAVLVVAAIVAAGCSGIPRRDRDQEQLERYLRYAKAPVDHITIIGHYDNWQAVGQYQLILWANINDAYLVTVSPPCENLQFAQRIGLTQTANTIYARLDAVLVKHWRCQITEIRPVDYLQMRRDQRAEREQQKDAAK